MLLSRELANFTRGESDSLRKAMGKKQLAKMEELYGKFMKQGVEKMAIKEKKTRKVLLARLYAKKKVEDVKAELIKEFIKEWLKKEREENGPFEIDDETGEERIVWYPGDYDENFKVRKGMEKWQYLLDGEDEPEEEE